MFNIGILSENFGLNRFAAGCISLIWSDVNKLFASKENPYQPAYVFFRLLGAICYGNNDTGYGSIKWSETAGDVLSIYGLHNNGTPRSQEEFFSEIMGFSKQEYNRFIYEIMSQHRRCSLLILPDQTFDESSDLYILKITLKNDILGILV